MCNYCMVLNYLEEIYNSYYTSKPSILRGIYSKYSEQHNIDRRRKSETLLSFDLNKKYYSTFCFRHKYKSLNTWEGKQYSNYADICLKVYYSGKDNDDEFLIRMSNEPYFYAFIKNYNDGLNVPYYLAKCQPESYNDGNIHYLVDFLTFEKESTIKILKHIRKYNQCMCP